MSRKQMLERLQTDLPQLTYTVEPGREVFMDRFIVRKEGSPVSCRLELFSMTKEIFTITYTGKNGQRKRGKYTRPIHAVMRLYGLFF